MNPGLVGNFYRNGKLIGRIDAAVESNVLEIQQLGGAHPIEKRKQWELAYDRVLTIGLGENMNTYEVGDEVRTRVYPQDVRRLENGRSVIIVTL